MRAYPLVLVTVPGRVLPFLFGGCLLSDAV